MIPQTFEQLEQLPPLWQTLAETKKPVVLYGMGDGADKILTVCEAHGIRVRGVFASDDFVRDKRFHGFPIERYADIKARLGDMVILVSFATRLPDVLERLYALAETDELYAPDVPVYGEEIFDSGFFASHREDFRWLYDRLSDETSRRVLCGIAAYRLTGDIRYLKNCETSVSEAYASIIRPQKGSVLLDIGAYTGDTISEYIRFVGYGCSVVAFEPDERNFRRLSENIRFLPLSQHRCFRIAAWDKQETRQFYARSGRGSAATAARKGMKSTAVPHDRVDEYVTDVKIDTVNIDAEGADREAIMGMCGMLKRDRPVVSCAVYHRSGDIFSLPALLYDIYGGGSLYLRHFPYVPGWDTNVYIRPKEENI